MRIGWKNESPKNRDTYWLRMPNCEPKLVTLVTNKEGLLGIPYALSPFSGAYDCVVAEALTENGAHWCALMHPDDILNAIQLLIETRDYITHGIDDDFYVNGKLLSKIEEFLND